MAAQTLHPMCPIIKEKTKAVVHCAAEDDSVRCPTPTHVASFKEPITARAP